MSDSFDRCKCTFCSRNKFKLITYSQCLKCKTTSYLQRLSRIDIYKNSVEYNCGFYCSNCYACLPSKTKKQQKIQIALEMCRCSFCSAHRNVYSIIGYCLICKKNQPLQRMKRIDKFVDKEIKTCGFQCTKCRYLHSEEISERPHTVGKTYCFGL